ncbi:hypothetical protein [Pseudoscardovia suis]|uniref:Uncharacterized protein n=1 Tax=Pseudoscardovia suis TaxID=987063 RepID=A0A261EWV5_9BIFI|nr:hypothetical protein [Pseudoscardovia suis]OZG51323.1 hypothetical protein PSSU_0946 [Pseudoscardovia suis]PJJ68794.1 hypothetical protein CLV65_0703 [Pseudoscardovia suis]
MPRDAVEVCDVQPRSDAHTQAPWSAGKTAIFLYVSERLDTLGLSLPPLAVAKIMGFLGFVAWTVYVMVIRVVMAQLDPQQSASSARSGAAAASVSGLVTIGVVFAVGDVAAAVVKMVGTQWHTDTAFAHWRMLAISAREAFTTTVLMPLFIGIAWWWTPLAVCVGTFHARMSVSDISGVLLLVAIGASVYAFMMRVESGWLQGTSTLRCYPGLQLALRYGAMAIVGCCGGLLSLGVVPVVQAVVNHSTNMATIGVVIWDTLMGLPFLGEFQRLLAYPTVCVLCGIAAVGGVLWCVCVVCSALRRVPIARQDFARGPVEERFATRDSHTDGFRSGVNDASEAGASMRPVLSSRLLFPVAGIGMVRWVLSRAANQLYALAAAFVATIAVCHPVMLPADGQLGAALACALCEATMLPSLCEGALLGEARSRYRFAVEMGERAEVIALKACAVMLLCAVPRLCTIYAVLMLVRIPWWLALCVMMLPAVCCLLADAFFAVREQGRMSTMLLVAVLGFVLSVGSVALCMKFPMMACCVVMTLLIGCALTWKRRLACAV